MTEPTDIEVYEPEPVTTGPTTGSLQRLEAEVAAMDKAYKIAKSLSHTQMVPEHFQFSSKPRGCTDPRGEAATWDLAAAILYGAELGLSAVASAQNVFVVAGKPAVYARTMAAQVRRAGFRIEEVEASNDKVVWRGERDGHWAVSEWSMGRAQQAGYTNNAKYQTNPQEMLRAKCIAEVCRIQYQDVLLGMAYSVEELQLDNVTVQRVVRQPDGRGVAALRELATKATEAQVPEVTSEPPTPTEIVEEVNNIVPPATSEQLDKIRKLFKARNVTGQAILGEATQFLQLEHKLASLHDLDQQDADALLQELEKPAT